MRQHDNSNYLDSKIAATDPFAEYLHPDTIKTVRNNSQANGYENDNYGNAQDKAETDYRRVIRDTEIKQHKGIQDSSGQFKSYPVDTCGRCKELGTQDHHPYD